MDECASLSPLGQMIDVGGYKLHLYSTGSGGPAVIIDSGLGGINSDWDLVQPEIAKFTQVVIPFAKNNFINPSNLFEIERQSNS